MEVLFKTAVNDELAFIRESSDQYNYQKALAGIKPKRINIVASIGEGQPVGGIISTLGYYGGLEVYILWVHKDFRGRRIGSRLLHLAEQQAIDHGGIISMLSTFSFQGLCFYEKHGYQEIGKVDNFPKNHVFYHLKKRLT